MYIHYITFIDTNGKYHEDEEYCFATAEQALYACMYDYGTNIQILRIEKVLNY